jgi:SAM-dependent methyltransferase
MSKTETDHLPTPPPAPAIGVSEADLNISVQARALPDLDRVLKELLKRDSTPPKALLDLGCGVGGLTTHIGQRLGITELIGADLSTERLEMASRRGVRPFVVNLERDRVPVASGSVGMVTCFGLLAYLTLYDNCLSEASRVLDDKGWLLFSMPNLGNYGNRLALLLGYQPHGCAVSRHRLAGTLGHPNRDTNPNMPPLLHGATLRCMTELLGEYGFDVVVTRGFTPQGSRRPVVDRLADRFPSLSRRFIILARKRAQVS